MKASSYINKTAKLAGVKWETKTINGYNRKYRLVDTEENIKTKWHGTHLKCLNEYRKLKGD